MTFVQNVHDFRTVRGIDTVFWGGFGKKNTIYGLGKNGVKKRKIVLTNTENFARIRKRS